MTQTIMSENNVQQNRETFLNKHNKREPYVRRDVFADFEQVNNYELPMPNTQHKLVLSLHKKKTDESMHLLKFQIGRNSLFIDAKTAFIVAEALRFLTDEIVPEDLKPTFDKQPEAVTSE